MSSFCLVFIVHVITIYLSHECNANIIFGFKTPSSNELSYGTSNNSIRVTLYWSARMYQCHVIPRQLNTSYYCNTSDANTAECDLPEPFVNGLQIDHTQGAEASDGLEIDATMVFEQLPGDLVQNIASVDSFCFHDAKDGVWRGGRLDSSCVGTSDPTRYDTLFLQQQYPSLFFNFSDANNVYVRTSAAPICDHGEMRESSTVSPASNASSSNILQVKVIDSDFAETSELDSRSAEVTNAPTTTSTYPNREHLQHVHIHGVSMQVFTLAMTGIVLCFCLILVGALMTSEYLHRQRQSRDMGTLHVVKVVDNIPVLPDEQDKDEEDEEEQRQPAQFEEEGSGEQLHRTGRASVVSMSEGGEQNGDDGASHHKMGYAVLVIQEANHELADNVLVDPGQDDDVDNLLSDEQSDNSSASDPFYDEHWCVNQVTNYIGVSEPHDLDAAYGEDNDPATPGMNEWIKDKFGRNEKFIMDPKSDPPAFGYNYPQKKHVHSSKL